MTSFTLSHAARICKVSPGRLRYWERTALLEPKRIGKARRAFAFRDLVSVKKVVELLDRGVPLRRIRHSMEAVRVRIPELEQPLGSLQVWLEDSRRVVVRHDGVLIEPDGQMVLDLEPSSHTASRVAPMAKSATRPALLALAQQTAIEAFERGCQLDGEPATYAEAVEAYRSALAADPEFADAHCNLGTVYFNQNRRALARACFERAIELDPRHVEAHLNIAMLLEEDDRNQAALRHYRIALDLDPLCADAHLSLGLLYEKLALCRKAREHWRRYLQIDPNGAWADIARRRLEE